MSEPWMRKGRGDLAAPSPEIQARHDEALAKLRPPTPEAVPSGGWREETVRAIIDTCRQLPREQAAAFVEALLPQSSSWLPIESAPRDGTVILVGRAKAVFDAWWQDGAWVDGHIGGFDDCLVEYQPTHWMPLPPSPQTSDPST